MIVLLINQGRYQLNIVDRFHYLEGPRWYKNTS